MSIGDELRIERLRRLHAKFLDSADEYPSLFHVACRSNQERLWKILSPGWLFDSPAERSLILPGWTNRSLEGLSDVDVHKKLHKSFWVDAVEYGGFCQLVYGNFVGPASLVTIGEENWMGRYANPDFDSAESASADIGYGPYDPAIGIIEHMSQEAAYHFVNPASPPPKVAEVFDEEIKARNPWLELLYRPLPWGAGAMEL